MDEVFGVFREVVLRLNGLFAAAEDAEGRVEQDGHVLRAGVTQGHLHVDMAGFQLVTPGEETRHEHQHQADYLPQMPPLDDVFLVFMELGVRGYYVDNQYEKDIALHIHH